MAGQAVQRLVVLVKLRSAYAVLVTHIEDAIDRAGQAGCRVSAVETGVMAGLAQVIHIVGVITLVAQTLTLASRIVQHEVSVSQAIASHAVVGHARAL